MVFEVGDARATTLAIGPRESTRKARAAGSRESARTSSAKPVSPRGYARAFLARAAPCALHVAARARTRARTRVVRESMFLLVE